MIYLNIKDMYFCCVNKNAAAASRDMREKYEL